MLNDPAFGNAVQARQAVQLPCCGVWSAASWSVQASWVIAIDTSGAGEACIVIVRAMAGCANSPKTISKTTSNWRGDTERMGVSVGEARKSSKKYTSHLRMRGFR
jgi:hypothetical protein